MYDMIMRISLGAFLTITLTFIVKKFRDWNTLSKISGPPGTTLAGNYRKVKGQPLHLKAMSWKATCKDLMRIRRFGNTLVVLNSLEAVQDAMVKKGDGFYGKPLSKTHEVMSDGYKGICSRNHPPIVEHMRKLVATPMQMYNVGVGPLEVVIEGLITEMAECFRLTKGKPFDPFDDIFATVTQMMCLLQLGTKLPHDDQLMDKIKSLESNIFIDTFDVIHPAKLLDTFSWLYQLPFYGPAKHLRNMAKEKRNIINYLKEIQKKNTEAEIGFQSIFSHLEKNANVGIEGYKFDSNDVCNVTIDMLMAGTFPLAGSVYSLINILMQHPKIQERIHKEIEQKIGTSRLRVMDESRLDYTVAVVLEVLRHSPPLPLGMTHRTVGETDVMEYMIPPNTPVVSNLFGILHDEDYWQDPWEFRPDRFLTKAGKLVPVDHPNRQRLLVYGAGPRACVGQAVARTRLFLITVMLVRHFVFRHPENDVITPCDPRQYEGSRILQCAKYRIMAIAR